MANRSFNRRQALEKEVKDLYLQVSFGSSGAPTIVSGVGISSIVRNSAGNYTVTLQDEYVSLKFVEAIFLKSSAEDIRIQLIAEDVDVAKTIQFVVLTGASATDPSSGSSMYMKIEVKNTSVT